MKLTMRLWLTTFVSTVLVTLPTTTSAFRNKSPGAASRRGTPSTKTQKWSLFSGRSKKDQSAPKEKTKKKKNKKATKSSTENDRKGKKQPPKLELQKKAQQPKEVDYGSIGKYTGAISIQILSLYLVWRSIDWFFTIRQNNNNGKAIG